MEITKAMKGRAEVLVQKKDSAKAMGSGSLLVYATPCMAALMEAAACDAIMSAVPEGKTTVGISMNIEHTSATPVGMNVYAEAEVTDVSGKIITFSLKAYDEKGQIGSGTHKRCMVDSEQFLDKTYQKF